MIPHWIKWIGFWCLLIWPLAVLAAPEARTSDQLEAGRNIFNFRCYFCHGYSGDARTLAASYMATKPRNFQNSDLEELPLTRMEKSISQGRPGTAMPAFATLLTPEEIHHVALFIRDAFMTRHESNTRYHTAENGWPDHSRYQAAQPFVLGEIPLDANEETLTPTDKIGKHLFMTSCITCHDRAKVKEEGPIWESRAVSWPRNRYSHRDDPPLDAVARATPYAQHDIPPVFPDLTPTERQGEALFQKNCAFCHAADGTGRNYIGTFLEPHPRNLTQPHLLTSINLEAVIREGIPNSSMPAWGTVLSTTEISAIMQYIQRAFGNPKPSAP
ncbi:MAG: c-type cytochrome [Magnetococcus sp. YQC-5]